MKFLLVVIASAAIGAAQQPSIGNPNAEGESLYRSNCAFCHGVTGKGGRGPDLTGRRNHGGTLEDVKRVIRQGITGTTMPSFANFMEDEFERLVEYTHALANAGAKSAIKLTGDPALGKQVYDRNACAACHAISGAGSIYGPDLTRIGAARSAEYIRESIVKPSADIPQEWDGVIAILKDGHKISGIRVNEDTFTLQLREQSGKFRMFDKFADLKEVQTLKQSLMPAYDRLPAKDLDNLLAYLDTLREEIKASGPAKKAKGIH